jgi:hypothetical protein
VNPGRNLIALAATACTVAAGVAGCSSHTAATSTTPGASTAAVRPGVWQTQDLTALSGAPEAVLGGVAGYVSKPDGTQHVVYVSKLGTHIVDMWRDAGGWHYKDLSAVTSAPPARLEVSGYAFQGAQHAIYLGTDHHIQDLWWGQGGVHVEDLTALTGGPLSTDAITGYGFDAQGTQHVIYFSWPDDNVHELWWDRNGWHHTDLAAVAGAKFADPGGHPVGYVYGGGQHVFYGGWGDRHMHELWSDSGGWHNNDLTLATGGTQHSIGGSFTAYPFETQDTQHVIYKSYPVNEPHLRELWWDRAGWHTDDLSAATGAPGGPWSQSGYAFEAQGTQHVILDAERILEVWWDPSGWHMDDLSAVTGAPPSGGIGPVGYAFEAEGTQHVVYTGRDDNHIHELWWGPRAPGR